ncbi:MAG: DNA-binding response regulator [Saprospirales bacterium]|nr:MAG: DNA-binding response regulator [Saprospirales bacterium]
MEHKASILLVDDEADIIEFLKYNLEKEGYRVQSALNGKQAIEISESFRPDLIILDIMMPEMDGVEVCRKIRQKTSGKQPIIAFLTARDEDYTQISALETGGDDYITKPIKPGVFISRVKALLRRAFNEKKEQEDPELKIQVGDLLIDREEYLVYQSGEKRELARKEFELLSLLAGKPGKVFKRAEILHKVWGKDVIVGNRTIDVHVRKLREKLGSKYIKTVKGIGYKFDF